MDKAREYLQKIQQINLRRVHNKKQKKLDKEYAEKGLTDEIFQKQLELNQEKHKQNIHNGKYEQ